MMSLWAQLVFYVVCRRPIAWVTRSTIGLCLRLHVFVLVRSVAVFAEGAKFRVRGASLPERVMLDYAFRLSNLLLGE